MEIRDPNDDLLFFSGLAAGVETQGVEARFQHDFQRAGIRVRIRPAVTAPRIHPERAAAFVRDLIVEFKRLQSVLELVPLHTVEVNVRIMPAFPASFERRIPDQVFTAYIGQQHILLHLEIDPAADIVRRRSHTAPEVQEKPPRRIGFSGREESHQVIPEGRTMAEGRCGVFFPETYREGFGRNGFIENPFGFRIPLRTVDLFEILIQFSGLAGGGKGRVLPDRFAHCQREEPRPEIQSIGFFRQIAPVVNADPAVFQHFELLHSALERLDPVVSEPEFPDIFPAFPAELRQFRPPVFVAPAPVRLAVFDQMEKEPAGKEHAAFGRKFDFPVRAQGKHFVSVLNGVILQYRFEIRFPLFDLAAPSLPRRNFRQFGRLGGRRAQHKAGNQARRQQLLSHHGLSLFFSFWCKQLFPAGCVFRPFRNGSCFIFTIQ